MKKSYMIDEYHQHVKQFGPRSLAGPDLGPISLQKLTVATRVEPKCLFACTFLYFVCANRKGSDKTGLV